jgi:hypothetical protein
MKLRPDKKLLKRAMKVRQSKLRPEKKLLKIAM